MPIRKEWSLNFLTDWSQTLGELQRNRFPDLDRIAVALRTRHAIPKEVREFLAELIEAKRVKRPPGRKSKKSNFDKNVDYAWVKPIYDIHFAEIVAERKGRKVRANEFKSQRKPQEEAYFRTTKTLAVEYNWHTSVATITNLLNRRGAWSI